MSRLVKLASMCVLASLVAAGQDHPKFKARELFYNPITPPQEKTGTTKSTGQTVKKTVRKTVKTTGQSTTTVNVPTQKAMQPEMALALRYAIQKRNAAGQFEDADMDSVFHSGDQLRMMVEANDTCYVYVVQQGSSGVWSALFPDPEINGGKNLVPAKKEILIPAKGSFKVYGQPGTEKLIIVLTRKPEQDMEKLILSLQQPGANKPKQDEKTMMASARLPGTPDVIGRLQQMHSRDLVFEKVDEKSDYGTKEKAYYAGTPDTSERAQVIATIGWKHE